MKLYVQKNHLGGQSLKFEIFHIFSKISERISKILNLCISESILRNLKVRKTCVKFGNISKSFGIFRKKIPTVFFFEIYFGNLLQI